MARSLLEQIRKQKGITQEELSNMLGISISAYSYYENGSRNIPLEVAEKLCKILCVKQTEIFLPSKFTASKYDT